MKDDTTKPKRRRPTAAERRFLASLDARPESMTELKQVFAALSSRLCFDLVGLEGEERRAWSRVLWALQSALEPGDDRTEKLALLDKVARKVITEFEPGEYERLAGLDVAAKSDMGKAVEEMVQALAGPSLRTMAVMVAHLPICGGLSIDQISDKLNARWDAIAATWADSERTAVLVLRALDMPAKDAANAVNAARGMRATRSAK